MNPVRTLRVFFVVLAALAPPSAVSAQRAADPFANRHAEILRATEAQLEFLRAGQRASASGVTRVNSMPPRVANRDPLAVIAEARVERARQQLLRLGVDAQRIFVEEGVPSQLLVIAAIESGFDPEALSSKGARGLWQLMPETARRFGLRVDEWVDERVHAARATRAAARYLRELYLLFGDWRLALAAYNAGEHRVSLAMERAGGRDFVLPSGLLPAETQRYVPSVLGAKSFVEPGDPSSPLWREKKSSFRGKVSK